jgi:1-acyl-sn-glycerol-3-phosphate acyltransferase
MSDNLPIMRDSSPVFNADPGRPGLFSRLFPSFFFYSRSILVIRLAARVLKAGCTDENVFERASKGVACAVNSVGARITVENLDVLRRLDGPCIVVANHMSSLETLVVPSIIMPVIPMTFVAKQSLMKYPWLSALLEGNRAIIVGRANPRDDLRIMTTETHERLSRGVSVVVFPQTTRSDTFVPEQFNSIGAKLARREGVPLIPLALKTDFWSNGKRFKDLGRIDPKRDVLFRFGEPIDSSNDREAHQKALDFICRTLAEWGAAGTKAENI